MNNRNDDNQKRYPFALSAPKNPLLKKINLINFSIVDESSKSEDNSLINKENEKTKQKNEQNLFEVAGKIRVNDYNLSSMKEEIPNENENPLIEENNKISNENSKIPFHYLIKLYFYSKYNEKR